LQNNLSIKGRNVSDGYTLRGGRFQHKVNYNNVCLVWRCITLEFEDSRISGMLNFGIIYVVKNFHEISGDGIWFFLTVLDFTSCILLEYSFILN
jgi:hypothetical protein